MDETQWEPTGGWPALGKAAGGLRRSRGERSQTSGASLSTEGPEFRDQNL